MGKLSALCGPKPNTAQKLRKKNMKTIKLTVKEITELQPTETSYASERGTVLGGIEVEGEIDHAALKVCIGKQFGTTADYHCEGIDRDGCVHFVIISAK